MKILIVSGFLGAGKTTFIKELIRQTGKQLVILENEYGENNLDSRELQNLSSPSGEGQNSSPLEVMEFMEGCICCSKKDSFANTVLAISAGLDPEYLVVEPTGVGKLSSILDNLQKIVYERIQVLPPVVVLSPQNIALYKKDLAEIYTDQIANAQHIVFSKIEHESPDLLEQARAELRAINAEASIEITPYQSRERAWWLGLLEPNLSNGTCVGPKSGAGGLEGGGEASSNLEFDQLTLHSGSLKNIGQLVVLLEDVLRGEFGLIYRAKGVIKVGGEWLRFDVADRLYGIIKEQGENPETQVVFIGLELDRPKLNSRLLPIRLGVLRSNRLDKKTLP